ncbi:hypothetical protein DM46_1894 [Burkholderia mallei]|nr:hypothetical protein DM46_1894 [Burkholderia mallei]
MPFETAGNAPSIRQISRRLDPLTRRFCVSNNK